MILTALLLQAAVQTEADAYSIERYTPPEGAVLEAGGIDLAPNGDLYVSTRRGQVWRVEDPLSADVTSARFSMFTEGLWEGLGLRCLDDAVYVVQRGELSRLIDVDSDGICDVIETVADGWGLSGHYHEFAFGLPRDAEGNWYVGLNVSFGDPEWWHGRSTVPDRGWLVRITPTGEVQPWASGFRSPCGVAMDSSGTVFVTDNQGDWCASSPIHVLRKGAFYGHPKSLNWTDEYREKGLVAHDEIPPARAYTDREPAAVWIPYKWSRSTGNLLEIQRSAEHGLGHLFEGQYVVAELTNGMLLRADFEEVQGVMQGWVLPLRQDVGSVIRVLEAPDGSILCGLTNRGWGGKAPADGLARFRWTGRTPMEIHSMRILDAPTDGEAYGFELTFTQPVAADWEPKLKMIQYDYDYWWEYGSPERHTTELELEPLELSTDRTKLVVRSFDLLPAMVARLTLEGCVAEDGNPLLHPEIAYTINQFPSGPKTNALVSKIVPPPPSKGAQDEGVLRLSWGDALGQFEDTGWKLCSATLDSADPTKFRIADGNGALVGDTRLVTRGEFGDVHFHAEFMLAKEAEGLVHMTGWPGGLRLSDAAATCGSWVQRSSDGGEPKAEVYRGAGEWHELDLWVTAPRLGADGGVLSPARIERAELDGVTIQEGLELPGVTNLRGKFAIAPMTPNTVAIRNVQAKPMDRPADARTWERLSADVLWDDWEVSGDAEWTLENGEVVGKGALGHLWLTGFEGYRALRFEAKVNGNGAGALVLDAVESDAGVGGTAVRVNSSFPDGTLTGSVGSAPIATELVAADTWVEVQVEVDPGARNDDGSPSWSTRRVKVFLNGVLVNVALEEGEPADGSPLALRVDHDGTVVRYRNFAVTR